MNTITLRLALRYLKPRRSFLSVVNLLCVGGIMLGVGTLIVVISVMSGFDLMWKDKLLTFTPHITLTADSLLPDEGPLYDTILAEPGVVRAEAYVEGLLFLEHQGYTASPFLRGLNFYQPNFLSENTNLVVFGEYSLEEEQVMLGIDLAFKIGARPESMVTGFAPQSMAGNESLRLPEELKVSGIFEVGMWQIDEGFAITGLDTARDLLGMDEGVHGIQITLENPQEAWLVSESLQAKLGPDFRLRTWMQNNQQLFGALQVEKRMMFFLLAIISVVACFMVMSTLITITVQKTREIGLMRAVGFSRGQIQSIFLWYGMIQGISGAILGTGVGLLVVRYRNQILDFISSTFQAELFPKELYFLSELPAQVALLEVLRINIVVLVMCIIAGWVPSVIAARRHPVESLRYE